MASYDDSLIALLAVEAKITVTNVATEAHRILKNNRPRSRTRRGAIKVPINLDILGEGIDTFAKLHAGGLGAAIIGGTRPHLILPARRLGKEAMVYAGAAHPFTSANHPGSPPHDFIARSLPEIQKAADKELLLAAEDVASKLYEIWQASIDAAVA